MEVKQALLARRSVRQFTEEAVSEAAIDALLHAAMSGPSACNCRPWHFYVITKPEVLEKLRGVTRFTRMNAPLAIVVCGEPAKRIPVMMPDGFWIQDCSAATENILLQATDLGLGAVWCGIHPVERSVEKVRTALNLPRKLVPLNILWVGHPKEDVQPRDQYDVGCVVRI